MKTPGPSKDELRADSGAVRSALVRPSPDRSRVPAWCSPNPRSYAFSNSLGNGVVGSCGSPGRVTRYSDIGRLWKNSSGVVGPKSPCGKRDRAAKYAYVLSYRRFP